MATADPIYLASPIPGLHLRLTPGSQEPIPGTGRFTLKQGKWLFFQKGTYVMRPQEYLPAWGSREAAIAFLKEHVRFGRDFTILPDRAAKTKSAAAPGAYGLTGDTTSTGK